MPRRSTFTADAVRVIGEMRVQGASWRAIGVSLGRANTNCRLAWVERFHQPGGWARPRGFSGCSYSGVSAARPEQDDGRADDGDKRTQHIPTVGACTFHNPAPEETGGNVDPAIGGVGSARVISWAKRQQPGKQKQTETARHEPQGGLAHAQPSPERETARYLSNGSGDVNDGSEHAADLAHPMRTVSRTSQPFGRQAQYLQLSDGTQLR